MAIIDPKQKGNLPLLSEVMQIDFTDDEEIWRFVNLKTWGYPFALEASKLPERDCKKVDWVMSTEYPRRIVGTRSDVLHNDTIAEYYAPPVYDFATDEQWERLCEMLEKTTDYNDDASIARAEALLNAPRMRNELRYPVREPIKKLIEFSQKIVTDFFIFNGTEPCLIWALNEWAFFANSIVDFPIYPHHIDNEKQKLEGVGKDKVIIVPIQEIINIRKTLNNFGLPHGQAGRLIQNMCDSLTSLIDEEQYKNLRRCIQCENIFLSNPIKRGQNEPKYCSDTCGSIYRTYKSRGKITAK